MQVNVTRSGGVIVILFGKINTTRIIQVLLYALCPETETEIQLFDKDRYIILLRYLNWFA